MTRILLFGSFSRGDYTARSDMDLLIVLRTADLPVRDRIEEFLKYCSEFPTDVFPLTEAELEARLKDSDPFWVRALREGIECYRR
ncbi:MAG: nucleotidyltransferase domain-containing protein [Acidobacteria bacterium]|nr:nucleotidyltransferase domain-containing protein [Acidobacteriota bacterium]